MHKWVGPCGPLDAQIVLIGEAPARVECEVGVPFKGSAGRYLDMLLRAAGLPRDALRITNLVKMRVPQDKISKVSKKELAVWKEKLIEEINDLPNVKVIVPLGNFPLEAVTGKSGITNFRGSPLKPISTINHNCIVIPTFHPSYLHYGGNWSVWPLMVADFAKAKRVAFSDEPFKFPTFHFTLKPSLEEVIETVEMLVREARPAVIDVETPHNLLSCIGLGWSRQDAICVPFFMGNGANYWTEEQELFLWKFLAKNLPKLELRAHNSLFDWRVLLEHGIHLKPPIWDSMFMHHCLYSDLPHKLDIVTSIYTDIAYYKSDEDEIKGSALFAGRELEHWEYNCMDCVATFWCIEELKQELEEEEMLGVYHDLYVEMFEPIFKLNIRGTPVDLERLAEAREVLKKLISQYTQEIQDATGMLINANSPKQVAELLYGKLGMQRYKRGGSTSKDVLKQLAHKYQTDVPLKIIDIREARRQLGLFSDENVQEGRVKCEYSLTRTATGRLASRKGRRGGMNLQNVKRGEQRRFFTAEPGEVLLGADQSQAEARIVAWYSKDRNMLKLFESGVSIHLQNAKNVYGEDISKSDPRYTIAKGLVHGGNYGLGPKKFSLMTGVDFSTSKYLLETYHTKYPGIRKNFHNYVEREIQRCRMLYNPFGRRQVFLGRLDDPATFRAGYAFLPQSTVSDVNKKALKFLTRAGFNVLLELHDGIIISIKESELKFGIEAFIEAYSTEFRIWDYTCKLPIEISYGPNWADMEVVEI